jgi:hypothetical protein
LQHQLAVISGGTVVICSTNGRRGIQRSFLGKPEIKRLLEIQRRRWEDNIAVDLRGIRWWGMNWIDLMRRRTIKVKKKKSEVIPVTGHEGP